MAKRTTKATVGKHRGRKAGTGIRQYAYDLRRLRLSTPPSTLQQIADWLLTEHGMLVTRERVRQVLNKLTTGDERAEVAKLRKAPTECTVCGRTCKTTRGLCGAHYERQKSGRNMNTPIQSHDDKPYDCKRCGKRVGSDVFRAKGFCASCYSNWRYHNIDEVKQKALASTAAWRKKKWRTDRKWRKRQQAYQAAWRKKRKMALAKKATTKTARALAAKERTKRKVRSALA